MPDVFFSNPKVRKRKRPGIESERRPKLSAASFKENGKKKAGPSHSGKSHSRNVRGDEELDSDQTGSSDVGGGAIDDMDLRVPSDDGLEGSGEEDENESPAEKRLRLAKVYLQSLKEDLLENGEGDYDAAELDREIISSRLKQDVHQHSGKVHLFIADNYDFSQRPSAILQTHGHRFAVTSAVVSESGSWLFTAGKEGSIIKWSLATGQQHIVIPKMRIGMPFTSARAKGKAKYANTADIEGHIDEILALAISGDGKYLASGGKDRKLGIWDVESGAWVKGFAGHKDSISALAFRKGTSQLYSASLDRMIRSYDLASLAYVETLFGHQDAILSIDALRKETLVSCGARDRTVRYWKITEESQLVFRGGGRSAVREMLDYGIVDLDADTQEPAQGASANNSKRKVVEGSIESVSMIDETTFISGGDSGSICLWSTHKKKPMFTQALAHGLHTTHSNAGGLIENPRWITSLASLCYSDIFVSGSWDGHIRIWKLDSSLRSFTAQGSISTAGIINSLQFINVPAYSLSASSWAQSPLPVKERVTPVIVAGIGQEMKFGRWLKVKDGGAKNGCLVVALHPKLRDDIMPE